ncbi:prolipoprotein diacylglyceryl transferase [Butyricicoccus porcorum]|nr:prolipoprotein diacylglyceryl transferase [Butyricicoccus porcorum]MDD6987466.1 prolipoprotein diacylglyceryl transferase [Butyricicoccus porcorum]MDY4482874.1 prolipoprotein diacylglyceryl transferase [Butyricicoccus porcorum]
MSQTVSFPGLGLEFHFSSVAFTIGSKPIYWYGIVITLGILLAIAYASKRSQQFGVKSDDLLDMMLFVLPIAIICARLYYVAFEWEKYKDNPAEIFAVWHGGLAIYGGLIGGLITAIVFCRVRKIDCMDMLDLVAGAVPIGQVLGRWGNFFNCEAFGSETSLPWRMVIGKGLDEAGQFGNHPTFFYESAWNAIGFVLLYFYSKKRKYRGEVLLLYFGWYGLGRFFIEGLRTDSLYLWGTGIRVSQVVALISVIIGFGGFLLNRVMPFLRETAAEVNDNDTNTEETT